MHMSMWVCTCVCLHMCPCAYISLRLLNLVVWCDMIEVSTIEAINFTVMFIKIVVHK